MKKIHSIIVFLFFAVAVFAQRERIQELEPMLAKQDGAEFAATAILLSEIYLQESIFNMAERRANDAYEKAKSIGRKDLQATALNRKGKAIEKLADGKKAALGRAYNCFEDSNRLTKNQEERLDNLLNMKALAERLNKPKDVQKVESAIAALKGSTETEDESDLFGNKKKKTLEELQQLQAEKLDLAKEKDNLKEELTGLSEEQKNLRRQQETLIGILANKEKAIVQMSEQQMKKELLLLEQERLLDSLTFNTILDSLELSQQEMQLMQKNAELGEREAELQLQKSHRNLLLALAGIFVLLAGGLWHRFQVIKGHNKVLEEKNRIIQEERERSESLLLNILPKAIADELKISGGAETQHYDNATVMFVDFIGFSHIAKQLTPQQLVGDLDHAFRHFDIIIEKYGLEKIKTIGDAYMCAGGLPNEDKSHPVNVIKAALEIQQFLDVWAKEKKAKGLPVFNARIGIHTGPLVAGVVGSKKFAYDIWGDTVNVASRMESSCEAGKVNISDSTFHRIKDHFQCEYRGKVPAKNVGEVEMYYVGTGNGRMN